MTAAAHPDHRSPWILDTRTLGRSPGHYRPVRLTAAADTPIGIEVIAIPAGHDVDLALRLESVTEGVLVSGAASGTAVGECSRCLTDVRLPVTAELRELYAYPGSTTDETTDDDELPRVVEETIDLEPLARDELTLAMPLVPLCRPDCPGLCSVCGEPLAELEQGHGHEILDPRWAALAEKFGRDLGDGAVASGVDATRRPTDQTKEN